MRKYGLKYDVPSDKHWVFGSSALPTTPIQQDGNWVTFLPKKEVQDLNGIEPSACVIFTILNCVEILIKKQYGLDRNYSDRFLAALVNTRGGGCSPDDACEFLRTMGVVPEEVWPFDATITSEDAFFSPIPKEVMDIAQEFKAEWDFNHDFVQPIPYEITKALKCSPLLISVYAWVQNEKGQFFRPAGYTDNHATTMFSEEEGNYRRVFDSYDGPIIKDVEWNSMPMIIKRFYVKKKVVPPPVVVKPVVKLTKWQAFISWLIKIYGKIRTRIV